VLFAGGLKLLGASVDLGRADFECFGDLVDGGEARVALPALHAAIVRSVDPTPQCERLLGGAALFAKFADCLAERGVGEGAWSHGRGVCPMGVLLSTGYTPQTNQISAPAQR
jgi:hypothetical protein